MCFFLNVFDVKFTEHFASNWKFWSGEGENVVLYYSFGISFLLQKLQENKYFLSTFVSTL